MDDIARANLKVGTNPMGLFHWEAKKNAHGLVHCPCGRCPTVPRIVVIYPFHPKWIVDRKNCLFAIWLVVSVCHFYFSFAFNTYIISYFR